MMYLRVIPTTGFSLALLGFNITADIYTLDPCSKLYISTRIFTRLDIYVMYTYTSVRCARRADGLWLYGGCARGCVYRV